MLFSFWMKYNQDTEEQVSSLHTVFRVKPDIITTAKGMGNGFPVAGVLISPKIQAKKGMLGTTFGGNYLACAASLAVLQILEQENLIQNAQEMGDYLVEQVKDLPKVKEVRSVGLMTGIELEMPCAEVRNNLLWKHKILTGNASNKIHSEFYRHWRFPKRKLINLLML